MIVVFLPLFGMSGIEGRMYQPLAAAVIAAMAAALVLAVTLVPIAAGFILRPPRTAATKTWRSCGASSGGMRRRSTSASDIRASWSPASRC